MGHELKMGYRFKKWEDLWDRFKRHGERVKSLMGQMRYWINGEKKRLREERKGMGGSV